MTWAGIIGIFTLNRSQQTQNIKWNSNKFLKLSKLRRRKKLHYIQPLRKIENFVLGKRNKEVKQKQNYLNKTRKKKQNHIYVLLNRRRRRSKKTQTINCKTENKVKWVNEAKSKFNQLFVTLEVLLLNCKYHKKEKIEPLKQYSGKFTKNKLKKNDWRLVFAFLWYWNSVTIDTYKTVRGGEVMSSRERWLIDR